MPKRDTRTELGTPDNWVVRQHDVAKDKQFLFSALVLLTQYSSNSLFYSESIKYLNSRVFLHATETLLLCVRAQLCKYNF